MRFFDFIFGGSSAGKNIPQHQLSRAKVAELVKTGIAFNEREQNDEALRCYNEALAGDPACAEAWANKGRALSDMGQWEAALACCTRAIELDANDATTLSNKGVALRALGEVTEALQCFEQAIRVDPACVQAWSNMGNLYYADRKDCGQAEACYTRALEIAPYNSDAWFNKGVVLGNENRDREAYTCFIRAHHAGHPAARAALGRIAAAPAVAALTAILTSEKYDEYRLWRMAAEFLGELADASAVETLAPLLDEDRYPPLKSVKKKVLTASGVQRTVFDLPHCYVALVRHTAVESLGKIGGTEAISLLTAAFHDAIGPLKTALRENKEHDFLYSSFVSMALGRINDKRALDVLVSEFHSDDQTRISLASDGLACAAETHGSTRAIDVLIAAWHGDHVGRRRAADHVMRETDSTDEWMRQQIRESVLGSTGRALAEPRRSQRPEAQFKPWAARALEATAKEARKTAHPTPETDRRCVMCLRAELPRGTHGSAMSILDRCSVCDCEICRGCQRQEGDVRTFGWSGWECPKCGERIRQQ